MMHKKLRNKGEAVKKKNEKQRIGARTRGENAQVFTQNGEEDEKSPAWVKKIGMRFFFSGSSRAESDLFRYICTLNRCVLLASPEHNFPSHSPTRPDPPCEWELLPV